MPSKTPPSKTAKTGELQRALLIDAVKSRKGKLWLSKTSAEMLPTTYAALVSLQKKKLIEPEQAGPPDVMSWKVTKAGREAAKS
jgi:hypothetical protein